MKIVVSNDSYKECLSAGEVAKTIGAALRERWPDAEVLELPLADGGEGTLDILAGALGASMYTATVHDPLSRPVIAKFAIAGDTAIVESAQAIGLALLSPAERNPLIASSKGLGELLLAAQAEGCSRIIVTLGGSATCDGGKGMLDVPGIEALKGLDIELLVDVNAPFTGPYGAARVFAPQKGAFPEDVEILEERMIIQAARLFEDTGVDVTDLPGAGAAGGIAGALVAVLGAVLHNGIDRVLDLVRFDELIQDADLIITGEGKSDAQTIMGKVPMGVLKRVNTYNEDVPGSPVGKQIPVVLVSGRIEDRSKLESAGFAKIIEVSPRDIPLHQLLEPGYAKTMIAMAIKDSLLILMDTPRVR